MPETIHRGVTGRDFEGVCIHAALGVHEHAALLVLAALAPGARLLDAGAGSGALTTRLASLGYDVIASDLDGSWFQGGTPIVEWDLASASLPAGIDPGSFDGVCAIETLEHVHDPTQALRNLYALLRPGGRLVVSTPNVTHPRSRVKFLLRGAPAYFGRLEFHMPGHRTILPDWLLGALVAEAGFEDAQTSYAGSMQLHGVQRLGYGVASVVFRLLGWLPEPRTDDGCITFITARKPV